MSGVQGLGRAGERLWHRIVGALPSDLEFDEREEHLLWLACAQTDDLAALDAAVERDGVVVRGSAGQPRLNAAVTEARQARIAIARLLADLPLPNEREAPESLATQRARRAAEARWGQDRERRAKRHA